jgi:stearoyl-CoA desaturase (Delta-9 desaturase)
MALNSKQFKFLRPNHFRVRANQYLAHTALIPAYFLGTPLWWIACFITFYFFHGIGSGCGAHRFFTHKSFKAPRWSQTLMACLFTLSSSGSVIGYVLIHTKHHRTPDAEGDPHDPTRMGALKTWLGILDKNHLTVDPRAYMRLRHDPLLRLLHDYYFLFIASYLLLVGLAFGVKGLVFLYMIPVVLQFHANSALIVLCHKQKIGYRNFETEDRSQNLIFPFRLWLLGEELHNNHHYRPGSCTMNVKQTWKELDPLFYLIKYVLSNGDVRVANKG